MVTLEPDTEDDLHDPIHDDQDENLPNTQSLVKTSGGFMLIDDLEDFEDFKNDGILSHVNFNLNYFCGMWTVSLKNLEKKVTHILIS